MGRYIGRRIFLFLPTLVLVTVVLFALTRLVPGDPALLILLGDQGEGSYTQEELDNLRHELGTDRPLFVQYYTWVWDMTRGDFGDSMWYGDPVWNEIKEKFPITLEFTVLAFIIGFGMAVPLGIVSAIRPDSWFDYVARIFSIAGIALPTFWVAILIIFVLVNYIDWLLPDIGYALLWEDPLTNLHQMIFPALVLGFYNMAFVARVTRSSMLDVMREDYVRTARAKGLWELTVIARHALKNAFLPVLTISGWQVGRLIGGTVIIESIFLVPGVGTTLIAAIHHRDFTMIQAIVFLVAVGVLVLNLVIDLLYAWIDPRIRYA